MVVRVVKGCPEGTGVTPNTKQDNRRRRRRRNTLYPLYIEICGRKQEEDKMIDRLLEILGLCRKSRYEKLKSWCQLYQKGCQYWIERYKKADTAARKFRELLLKAQARIAELEAKIEELEKVNKNCNEIIFQHLEPKIRQLEAQQQPKPEEGK